MNLFAQERQSRILIVDDEPFNLQSMKVIIQQSLKRLGHPKELLNDLIDVATNGDVALNKVIELYTSEELKQQYSLIIMDCQMPQMDGYEATKEIRKFITRAKRQQPQIIACTGHVEESLVEKAWRS